MAVQTGPPYEMARGLPRHCEEKSGDMIRGIVFLVLCFVLLVTCAVCWVFFHIAGALLKLLIFLALVFLVLHFLTRRRAV